MSGFTAAKPFED